MPSSAKFKKEMNPEVTPPSDAPAEKKPDAAKPKKPKKPSDVATVDPVKHSAAARSVGKVDKAHAKSVFEKAQEDNFNLPIDQNQAVANYTGASYKDINNQLRSTSGKPGGGQTGKHIAGIDAAFASGATVTEKNTVLFRGLSGNHLGDISHGSTFTDHGFVSTSYKDSFAKSWAKDFKENPTVAEIVIPKGTRVLGGDAGQHELILNRGSRFKVLSVAKTTEGKSTLTRIRMELVS